MLPEASRQTSPSHRLVAFLAWLVVVAALAVPLLVVTGTLREVPVLGSVFGPPSLVPSAPVDVGTDVTDLTAGDGSVWLLRAADHKVLRAGDDTEGILVPEATRRVVAGGGRLWLLAGADLLTIDPNDGAASGPVPLQTPDGDFRSFIPDTMAWGGGRLWVLDDDKLLSVGPEGTVSARSTLPLGDAASRTNLVAGKDAAWVFAERRYDVAVVRVDTSGRAEEVARLDGVSLQPFGAGALARGALWFAARDKASNRALLVGVDERTGRVSRVRFGSDLSCPMGVEAGAGTLWARCGPGLDLLAEPPAVEASVEVYREGWSLTDWVVDERGRAWFVSKDGADRSLLQHVERAG